MRGVALIGSAVVVLALLFVLSVLVASETGGELVTVTTQGADGAHHETRLWVVDADGSVWLRSGAPTSGWFLRLESRPEVQVARAGTTADYTAVPVRDPEMRERVHALMREKYGLADSWISVIRDGTQSIPVRLDPSGGNP